MKDPSRISQELIEENASLKRRITELEASESDRKQAEEALRERDIQFMKLSSWVPGMIYQFTKRPDGTYCVPFTTEAIKDIFGCSPEDVRDDFSPIATVILSEDLDKVLSSIEYSAKHMTTWTCEYRVQIPARSIRWLLGNSTPEKLADGSITWHGFNTDITDRKKTEETLRESEEKYRILFENANEAIFVAQDWKLVFLNPMTSQMIGYSPEELMGRPFVDFIHPDDRNTVVEYYFKRLNGEDFQSRYPFRCITKDGRIRWVEISVVLIDWAGRPAALNFVTDITDRKQAEETLSRSEEKLHKEHKFNKLLLDMSPALIVAISADGKTLMMNQALLDALEYTKEEIKGSDYLTTFVPEEDRGTLAVTFQQIAGEEKITINENRIISKSGKTSLVEWHGRPAIHGEGELAFFVGVGIDITERKRTEEQLYYTLDSLRKSFSATVQVLVSAVETRDPYTAGHQIRSADLARAIATEMELPQDRIDGIRMAGAIHDIGKLSVPAEILSRPTKLTELEFSLIKEHAQRGFDMLKDVESPWPLAEIVYQHHERMDGSGYPRHLKGEAILMEARILAVADVVESMASHRPYRPSLGIDAALNEIEKNSGTFYDNTVVDACLKLFKEKGYKMEG